MNLPFRIEQKEGFRIVGYAIHTTNQKQAGRKDIPAFWNNFHKLQQANELYPHMNQEPYGIFGISVYNVEDDARKFIYYIGVSSNDKDIQGLESYEVPAMTWAVFPCTIDTVGKTEVQAITKWLPKSKYRPLNTGYLLGKMKSNAPDIQCYGENDSVEVWVAVKEK